MIPFGFEGLGEVKPAGAIHLAMGQNRYPRKRRDGIENGPTQIHPDIYR